MGLLEKIHFILFSCEMVVTCEQKRLGDDHLELDFQAVVDFLMRGWEPLGLLQEQCVLSMLSLLASPRWDCSFSLDLHLLGILQ